MYQNQPGSQHYHQPLQQSGPPPAKRPRGNPIITRYPPPPGYRAPMQPQPPFVQQPTWQPPQTFPPTHSSHGNFQQPLGQTGFAAAQQHQIHAPQQYAQAPHPASMSTWQTPQSAPPQTWQSHQSAFGLPPDTRRHNSLPYPSTGTVLDGNGDPLPPADLTLQAEDLEEDFDAECYFARFPDQINPTLSLGIIEWKAPRPGRRALPATFAEAEIDAIAPRVPRPSDDESISDYFISSQREESLLSVRQTEAWNTMKDDLIFQDFSAVCSRIISLSELFDSYRVQFDPSWEETADRDSSTPGLSRGSTPAGDQCGTPRIERDMDLNERIDSVISDAEMKAGPLDELERALQGDTRSSRSRTGRSNTPADYFERHSRAGSMSSQHAKKPTRPKPLPPLRDEKQEDILASLGVTGSPKLVYQTPGPAFGPRPSITSTGDNHSRASSVSSTRSGLSTHAAPFKPQTTILDCETPGSNATHLRGSTDAEPDNDATPRPKHQRNDSTRKRSYADATAGATDDSASENDEATPRQRRKQARVDSH